MLLLDDLERENCVAGAFLSLAPHLHLSTVTHNKKCGAGDGRSDQHERKEKFCTQSQICVFC